MIEISSFKEMALLHQSGRVPFRIIQEITVVLLGLSIYPKDIPQATDVTRQEIDWLLSVPEALDFMTYLGGNVYICETESDLLQVTSMDIEFGRQHGRWPNCTEAVLAWDDCRYLLNADGTADYAVLFAATNNAGGPSWFIPKHLWQVARIEEQIEGHQQIEAHQQCWSVAK